MPQTFENVLTRTDGAEHTHTSFLRSVGYWARECSEGVAASCDTLGVLSRELVLADQSKTNESHLPWESLAWWWEFISWWIKSMGLIYICYKYWTEPVGFLKHGLKANGEHVAPKAPHEDHAEAEGRAVPVNIQPRVFTAERGHEEQPKTAKRVHDWLQTLQLNGYDVFIEKNKKADWWTKLGLVGSSATTYKRKTLHIKGSLLPTAPTAAPSAPAAGGASVTAAKVDANVAKLMLTRAKNTKHEQGRALDPDPSVFKQAEAPKHIVFTGDLKVSEGGEEEKKEMLLGVRWNVNKESALWCYRPPQSKKDRDELLDALNFFLELKSRRVEDWRAARATLVTQAVRFGISCDDWPYNIPISSLDQATEDLILRWCKKDCKAEMQKIATLEAAVVAAAAAAVETKAKAKAVIVAKEAVAVGAGATPAAPEARLQLQLQPTQAQNKGGGAALAVAALAVAVAAATVTVTITGSGAGVRAGVGNIGAVAIAVGNLGAVTGLTADEKETAAAVLVAIATAFAAVLAVRAMSR